MKPLLGMLPEYSLNLPKTTAFKPAGTDLSGVFPLPASVTIP